MPISVNCPKCGKRLQAPDSAAGKRAQCPDCQTVMQLPEAVQNAEPVDDGYGVAGESGPSGSFLDDLNQAVSSPAPPTPYQSSGAPGHAQGSAGRRPCPACGEMIVVGAAKCRFCGEIFDRTLRRTGSVDRDLIRKFRREIHGLGGFWIFIGGIVVIGGLAMSNVRPAPGIDRDALAGVGMVMAVLGGVWVTIGILTCMKHMWAVYVGLVLSYLSAVGNLVNLAQGQVPSLIGLIIVIVVIVQAHRTIGWASRMRSAGVPLTTKP